MEKNNEFIYYSQINKSFNKRLLASILVVEKYL